MRMRDLLTPIAVTALLLCAVLPPRAEAGDEKAAVGSEPPYPSGTDYDIFTATLPGLLLLLDANGDGALNDERCDSNGEARLALVGATIQTLTAAGIACNALPSPAQEVCFGVLTTIALALQAEAIVVAQCRFQDGLVQAAEITAAYQNTRHILTSRLEEDLLACNLLISLRFPQASGGRAEEVQGVVQLRIEQYEAAGLAAVDSSKARVSLNKGVTHFAAGRYPQAFADFCQAYSILSAAAK
jgi:hypothetical protein